MFGKLWCLLILNYFSKLTMDDYCKEFLLKNLMDHFDKNIWKQSNAIVLAKQQYSMIAFSKLQCIFEWRKGPNAHMHLYFAQNKKNWTQTTFIIPPKKWAKQTQGMKCEENTLNNHTHRCMVSSWINNLSWSSIGDGWGCELCLAIARFRSPLETLALD